MITAVGVVVPAHNEARRVRACLASIKVALAALPTTCGQRHMGNRRPVD